MSERYSRIAVFPENQYTTGSPIIVVAGVLLKDWKTDNVLVQLKFQNISCSIIEGVKIRIHASDLFGQPLEGYDEYQYIDLSAKTNDTFGQDKAIKMPDKNTRQCNLIVTEVIFNDKSFWKNTAMVVYHPIPKQISLAYALKNNELVEQYRRETTPSAKYRPGTHLDLWLCCCGKINKREYTTCQQCKVELRALTAAANLKTLEQHRREYDEDLLKKTNRRRKNAQIIAVILVVTGILYYVVTGVVLPNRAYNTATVLFEENNLDAALAAFTELGDYKDSVEMVIKIKAQQEKDARQKALAKKERELLPYLTIYKDYAESQIMSEIENAKSKELGYTSGITFEFNFSYESETLDAELGTYEICGTVSCEITTIYNENDHHITYYPFTLTGDFATNTVIREYGQPYTTYLGAN